MKQVIRIFLLGSDLSSQTDIVESINKRGPVFESTFMGLDEFIRLQSEVQWPDLILVSDRALETNGEGHFFERTSADGRSIPVIVIGEKDTAEEAVRFMKLGAADYIPFTQANILELPQKIINLIKGQKKQDSHARAMETLGRISLTVNRTRDLFKVLDLICKESGELFNVSAAFIWLLEGEELVGFAGYGYRREDFIGMRVSLADSIILGPRVIREKRPLYVNDAPNSHGVDPALIAHFNTQSILGTPLIVEDRAIGALILLDNYNPHRFRDDDIELAGLLGSHAAIAISNARLYEEISERVKEASLRNAELEALREASFHLTANLELKPLLEAILEQAMRLIDANNVHVFLYQEENINFGAARWADGREVTPYSTVRSNGLTATVIRSGREVIIPDVNKSPLYEKWRWGGGIAGFPLKIGEELLGVMNIATRTPHIFDTNEQRILKLFADEAAIAIKNAQLFEATRRQLEELAVLHAVALVGVKAIDEDYLIEETTRIIGDTFYPHNFGVILLDESKKVLHIHPSYRLDHVARPSIRLTEGVVGRVASIGKTIRVDDVLENEYYLEGDPETRSELCVPLRVGDRTMGVINAESVKVGAFSASDERLLTTLAGQLAIALERLRTENVERLQRRRLLIISDLAREMTGSLKVQELCTIISEQIRSVFDYYNVSIFLVDAGAQEVILQYNAGAYHSLVEPNKYRLKFGEGLIGQTAETGKAKIFNDTSEALGFFELAGESILSEVALPLKVGNRVLGVLNIDSSKLNAFSSGDIAALLAISDQLAIALEKARLFEETSQRSEDLQSAQDILHALNAHPNVVNAFPKLSSGLKILTNCDRVSIALLEEDDTWFSIYALDQPRSELEQGARMPVTMTACTEDVLAGRTHLTPVLLEETTYPAEKALYDAGHRSRVNIPLFVEDRVIGTLNLVWSYEAGYVPHQMPLLSQIAQAIALAVEKTRLFSEVRQRARELNLLNKIIGAAATAQTGVEVLEIGCKELAQFFDVPQAALGLLDESMTYETIVAEYLAPGRLPVIHEQIPVKNNAALQEVLNTGRPLAIENVQTHPATGPARDLLVRRGTISLLLVPIPVRGRIVGTMGIDAIVPRIFTPEELRLAKTVGEELGRALETTELHEKLQAHAAELEARVSERTKELADANEQLKELDRLKSKFISDVSHELRTPVANLWLYLDLMERGRSEKRDHYLGVLKQETKRLEQLIENTLNLSRLDMSDTKASFEEVDINALVAQIIVAYQPRAEMDRLTFGFTPGEAIPPVNGAKNQLAQVINNLLSNAFNYTLDGFVHVRTFSDDEQNEVVVEVIDSGIGIEKEDLPHLFDRFYRGQHTGQSDIPGTGLGLAIAKEIVDLHHGWIEVDCSEAGQTVFRVRLPSS